MPESMSTDSLSSLMISWKRATASAGAPKNSGRPFCNTMTWSDTRSTAVRLWLMTTMVVPESRICSMRSKHFI